MKTNQKLKEILESVSNDYLIQNKQSLHTTAELAIKKAKVLQKEGHSTLIKTEGVMFAVYIRNPKYDSNLAIAQRLYA